MGDGIAMLGIYLIILWAFGTVFGARAVCFFIVAVVSLVILGSIGFMIYVLSH
jgi:hypothetical protein